MPPPIIITIDGYSACGKSTLARELAKKINYTYLDTGAMYRAMTLYFMRLGVRATDDLCTQKHLFDNLHLSFAKVGDSDFPLIHLNGECVEKEIRTMEVSTQVSAYAALACIRAHATALQQKIGAHKALVADGRDMGTVVFPNAALKIFITASVAERAKRRWKELQMKNIQVAFEEVLANVRARDEMDSGRKNAPLIKADDAILIDNTDLSEQEQFDQVYRLVQQRMSNS